MATLNVSATGTGLHLQGGGPGGLDAALGAALAGLPPAAPVVLLVHGYKFDPADPARDPRRSLFAARPPHACRKLCSWPDGLGLSAPGAGLAIGFAWPATASHLPSLLAEGRTGFARVYERAPAAGAALAELVARIQRRAPWRRVDVLAHSLGARVALAALPHLARAPSRMILLGAAEFDGRARAFLADGPLPGPAVYNITARANDVYDLMFEAFAPRAARCERALGRGLGAAVPNWLDLQLDRDAVTAWLGARGIPLAPATARCCHWSFYTRPGAFALYRAILGRRPGWDVAALRAEPCLAGQEPHWSRLIPALTRPAPMPAAGMSLPTPRSHGTARA